MRGEQIFVVELAMAVGIDAELPDHLFGDGGIGVWRRNVHRAAIADERSPIERELVAFRVPAEVVVIVEDQDARVRVDVAMVDVRRRQATDARTDNNKIVVLIDLLGRPLRALNRGMGYLERARVRTAHAGLCRRVVRRRNRAQRLAVSCASG